MYRIFIEKIESVDYVSKEWKKRFDDAPFDKVRKEDSEAEQYRYVETPSTKTETTKVFEQTRDNGDFDFMGVIKAFNNEK